MVLVGCLVASGALVAGAVGPDGASSASADAADDRSSAEQIQTNTTVDGTVSGESDVDWYAVNVTAGDAVVPHLYLENDTDGRSLQVQLYGPNGTPVGEEKKDAMGGPENVAGVGPIGEQDAHAVSPNVATVNATYYVKVSESEYASTDGNVTSAYNLTVETKDLDRYDPNENGSTATHIGASADATLTGNASVEAVATPYDRDVYAVTLAADQNYTVTLSYANASDSDHYPKLLRLFPNASAVPADDSPDTTSGRELTEMTDGGETVTFTVEETGTYYLHLGQSSNTNQLLNEDAYELSVQRGTPEADDPGDGTPDEDC